MVRISNFLARFHHFVFAELGMSLRLRESQGRFQSRSPVPSTSPRDWVTSWSLSSAAEREVEIARTGEDPPEAGEHAPRKERSKKRSMIPSFCAGLPSPLIAYIQDMFFDFSSECFALSRRLMVDIVDGSRLFDTSIFVGSFVGLCTWVTWLE